MTPIERAAAILVDSLRQQDARTPREAALRAHHAGGPGVDELERRIVSLRQRQY